MRGAVLRGFRKQLRLTQAALAKRLGVTSNTVARWERGVVPIRDSMVKLIRMLVKLEKLDSKTTVRRRP